MEKLAILGGTPVRADPFPSWPVSDEKEEQAVLEVLRSGNWWRYSHGQAVELAESEEIPFSKIGCFQRDFARFHDCKYGIAAANGTVTLEIGLRALGIQPGDEVLVPAYTFVATAAAPLMAGAIPVFVDIDADTYNIDPIRAAEAITPRTRAIIPVHFGGQPCDMDAINALAKKYNLKVLEDAAHAHGSAFRGQKCGSLGHLGSFSFQASKNMTAGEGGIITTNDAEITESCEMLVWVGRRRGQPWYSHYTLATNARMTEFQAAILQVQLGRLQEQTDRRMANAHLLDSLLSEIDGVRPTRLLPNTTRHAYHLYMFRYDARAFNGLKKDKFAAALLAEGISGASTGYGHPLYANPMFIQKSFLGGSGFPVDAFEHGRKINYADFEERCPITERACKDEAMWFTQNLLLADEKGIQDIAGAVRKIQANASNLL